MSKFISEIRFVGMRRGGQHGVINWLRAQKPLCNGACVQHNLILSQGASPFANSAESPYLHLFRTYEDLVLEQLCGKELSVSVADRLHYVLLVRDPFNQVASKIHWKRHPQRLTELLCSAFVKLWKEYAREFLDLTNILPNKVVVSFNRWFTDKTYRRVLSSLLGLEFSDVALNQVSPHGSGSSFDSMKYDGSAQNMEVLARYKVVVDDPLYQAVCEDKELCELSREIFGEIRNEID